MAEHVCPFWIGYLLASPLRKIMQNPHKILQPFLQPGMKTMDMGSAMGFFSLPMAEMVQPKGMVYCVDIQPKMLKVLEKKAQAKKLASNIETIISSNNSLNIKTFGNQIDFVLAMAVVHEVPDTKQFFSEIFEVLKPGGTVLFSEPSGHVSKEDFQISLDLAAQFKFNISKGPVIRRSHSAILQK